MLYNAGGGPRMSLARNIATVGSATLFSRLLGFARDMGVAAVVARAQVKRHYGGEAAARLFAGQLIGTFAVALSGAVIVFAVAMPAIVLALAPGFIVGGPRMTIAVELARLMLPYLALAGPVAVLMGTLNANGRFAAAAYATTAFNATMLAALLVVFVIHAGDSQLSGRIIAFSVAVAGIA